MIDKWQTPIIFFFSLPIDCPTIQRECILHRDHDVVKQEFGKSSHRPSIRTYDLRFHFLYLLLFSFPIYFLFRHISRRARSVGALSFYLSVK